MDESNIQAEPVENFSVPRFLSVAELIVFTGLSRSSINRQIQKGKIPVVRIGNRILIPYSYLNTLQVTADSTVKAVKNEK